MTHLPLGVSDGPAGAATSSATGGDRALRVAWFSPMPPSPSGIAAYSAELLPRLRGRHLEIDVFAEQSDGGHAGVLPARDFVWRHRRQPYELTVYHLGNARCHDYMWGYLFRYPGLVVLHDAQVHQARASSLLQRWRPRRDDYLAEFRANHPDAPPDLGLLFAEGLGGALYAHWPGIRLVLTHARLVAVHSAALAARLHATYDVAIADVPMGVADPRLSLSALTSADIRRTHGIPEQAIVIGAFGGITPEKRVPALLDALAALAAVHPRLHLMCVGQAASHYDVVADAAARGLAQRVHVTGFVPDDDLGAYLATCDIAACLRWPSNGETSASWWRAMAAGRATIVTDLVHQPEVPVLDPRGWRPLGPAGAAPVAVALPILDEARTLVDALDMLVRNAVARQDLGTAARACWQAAHTLDHMAAAYGELLSRAARCAGPPRHLPAHLDNDGDARLTALLAPFGINVPAGVAPG